MIEETAVVVAAAEDSIVVEVQQQTACGSCSAKTGCGTHMASSLFKSRSRHIELPNHVNAKPGDRVVLGIDESDILSGSIRLYVWPMLGLIGGAIMAHRIAVSAAFSAELFAILGGLIGMITAFYLARRSESRHHVEIRVLRREPAITIHEIRQV